VKTPARTRPVHPCGRPSGTARDGVSPGRQHGAVLLFGLVVLAVMLIGSVAMVRSVEQSLFGAGNLGFKRDMGNQAERAALVARDLLETGPLSTPASRESHRPANNYRASVLPENGQGIPVALVGDDAAFVAIGDAANDIEVRVGGVAVARVRWLLDRLCRQTGVALPSDCVLVDDDLPGASGSDLLNAEDASAGGPGATPIATYYRLSVRVDGPRGTRGFFQSLYAL
jgi:type IV pilus assembly protein PilX